MSVNINREEVLRRRAATCTHISTCARWALHVLYICSSVPSPVLLGLDTHDGQLPCPRPASPTQGLGRHPHWAGSRGLVLPADCSGATACPSQLAACTCHCQVHRVTARPDWPAVEAPDRWLQSAALRRRLAETPETHPRRQPKISSNTVATIAHHRSRSQRHLEAVLRCPSAHPERPLPSCWLPFCLRLVARAPQTPFTGTGG